MKIRRVFANNKRKSFRIETSKHAFDYPYTHLQPSPHSGDPIVNVQPDAELGREAFSYHLSSGKGGTVHLDSVLAYNQDPDFLCELLLHDLTLKALEIVKKQKIAKREIARRLKTSPRQVYRLLDPAYYGKTLNQMVRLLSILGQKVEFVLKEAA